MTATNEQLAAECRTQADRAMRHRRAWLCLAVLLDTTRTVAGARALIDEIPEPLRDTASDLLAELSTE